MVLHYPAHVFTKKEGRKKSINISFWICLWLPTALQLKNTNLLRKHDKDQPKHPNFLLLTLTWSSPGGGRDYKSCWCQQKGKQMEIQSAFRRAERNWGLVVHLDGSLEGGKRSWQQSQNLRWALCLTMYL